MSAPVVLTPAQIAQCKEWGVHAPSYAARLTRERDAKEAYDADREARSARVTLAIREAVTIKRSLADELTRARESGQRGAECLRRYVLTRALERAGIR